MEHALIKKGHHCGMEALVAIGFWSSNIIFDLSCMKFSLSNTTAVIISFENAAKRYSQLEVWGSRFHEQGQEHGSISKY